MIIIAKNNFQVHQWWIIQLKHGNLEGSITTNLSIESIWKHQLTCDRILAIGIGGIAKATGPNSVIVATITDDRIWLIVSIENDWN